MNLLEVDHALERVALPKNDDMCFKKCMDFDPTEYGAAAQHGADMKHDGTK